MKHGAGMLGAPALWAALLVLAMQDRCCCARRGLVVLLSCSPPHAWQALHAGVQALDSECSTWRHVLSRHRVLPGRGVSATSLQTETGIANALKAASVCRLMQRAGACSIWQSAMSWHQPCWRSTTGPAVKCAPVRLQQPPDVTVLVQLHMAECCAGPEAYASCMSVAAR